MLLLIYFKKIFICLNCLHIYAPCAWCPRRPVEENIRSPGMELKVVVSQHVVLGTKPGSSARAASTVNHLFFSLFFEVGSHFVAQAALEFPTPIS